jgi:hypothetical protein
MSDLSEQAVYERSERASSVFARVLSEYAVAERIFLRVFSLGYSVIWLVSRAGSS